MFLKDVIWYIYEVICHIFLFVFFGWKIKYIKRKSLKYWLGKKFQKNIILFDCDDILTLYIPLFKPEIYSKIVQGEYHALKGYFSKYMPKEGDIVIDAGAYHGLDTIIFSLLVGDTGKVVSFEPENRFFSKLKKNVEYHKLKNVVLVNKGLSSKNLEADFFINDIRSSFVIGGTDQIRQKALMVKLDDELFGLGIKKVDFIKIDIEGSEIEAVKGAEKTLKSNNLNLAIASYHIVDGQPAHFKLEELLKEYGYKTTTGHKDHLTTYGWREK